MFNNNQLHIKQHLVHLTVGLGGKQWLMGCPRRIRGDGVLGVKRASGVKEITGVNG